MSCQFFPYHQFIDHINKTDIVLTSSSQLAEDINQQYTLHKLSSNISAWDTPSIYSWRNWLKILHFSSHSDASYTLLNQGLSVNILQNFIDDEIDNTLIKSSLLASNFYENLNLVSNLCIPHSEIEQTALTDDEKLFSKVITNYQSYLNDMSWLDIPTFYKYALENIKLYCRDYGDNTKITFVGFNDPLPLEELFIQKISEVFDTFIIKRQSLISIYEKVSYESNDSEFRAAGAWARKILEHEKNKKIGIIVHKNDVNLKTERIINDGFAPGWQLGTDMNSSLCRFKESSCLGYFPFIKNTLILLKWLDEPTDTLDICCLLMSKYFQDISDSGSNKLDDKLRQKYQKKWTITEFIKAFKKNCDQDEIFIIEILELLQPNKHLTEYDESPKEWLSFINNKLKKVDWLTLDNESNSDNFIFKKWIQLLKDCEQSLISHESISYLNFIKLIESTAENTYIQAHPLHQQVKILEYNDAIEMEFDYLWLSGLDNHVWPNKHKHYSFFSRELQNQHNFPESTPNKSAEHEKKLLSTLMGSSKNVVLSYARSRDEMQLSFTDLITIDLEESDIHKDPGNFSESNFGLENFIFLDEDVPIIKNTERLKGGASTVQRFKEDPFSGFALGRLKINEKRKPSFGIDPLNRGTIVHNAIAIFYDDLPSQTDMKARKTEQIQIKLNKAISEAFHPYLTSNESKFEQIFFDIEKNRTKKILEKLIDFDLNKDNFKLKSVEKSVQLKYSNIILNLKIDRIEEYTNKHLCIIDFKTGKVRKILDKNKQFKELQLFVYAAACDEPIDFISYIYLKKDNVTNETLTSNSDVKKVDPANDAIKNGVQYIYSILDEVIKGNIDINLKTHIKNDIGLRHLHVVSRIRDLMYD
tara:strand:+ start:3735 stop:6347 length:2613 start_codon:yes stop_codon:yes gene_type:complete